MNKPVIDVTNFITNPKHTKGMLLTAFCRRAIMRVLNKPSRIARWQHQILRIMQLTAVLLLMFSLTLSARSISQTLSFTGKNVPLQTVFEEIENQTGFVVTTYRHQLKDAKMVTLDVKNIELNEFLQLVLKNQPLSYAIDGKTIFIKKKTEINKPSPELETPPINVRGRVVNENGEPVIASVTIKGTNKGTTSNANGEFELNNINSDAVLIISATNIETVTINVNNQSNLFVSVKNASASLNEVVVNKGYYSESRRLSTGNVATVDAKTIEKQPISNPLQAIQGRMAGVYVHQQSGVPGGGFNIKIRGTNSLRSEGNAPLYIVDGVPFVSSTLSNGSTAAHNVGASNPLNILSVQDIENIEVLKDADATSIYGSRGSNGVVLITTKKGRKGPSKVNLNVNKGIGTVPKKMDLLTTPEYLTMRRDGFKNDGVESFLDIPEYDIYWPDLKIWDSTRYTDWQKKLIGGKADFLNAGVSLSGGNEATQFQLSANYNRETTVFPGDFNFQKGAGHLYIQHAAFNNKLNISVSTDYSISGNNLPGDDFTNIALKMAPNAPAVYDENGNLNWDNGTFGNNPFALLKQTYHASNNNFISNLQLDYEVIPNLHIKSRFGYNALELDEVQLLRLASKSPYDIGNTGVNLTSNASVNTWIIEPQAEYKINVKNQVISFLAGSTFQNTINEKALYKGEGYTNDALIENLFSAPSFSLSQSAYSKYRYNALFGRINYNYADKYIVNLTGRRDGSSRFGPDRQFADFGAVGAAWIFSNENYFKKYTRFLSYGKLRASYGTAGNDLIGDYEYLDSYSPLTNPYNGVVGIVPSRLVNRDYSWESNKKLELGTELGFFNDNLFLSFTYFQNRSSNQLVGFTLPVITGQSSIQYNFPATVQNTGIEINLSGNIIHRNDFKWRTDLNITVPKSKLLAFPDLEKYPAYANSYVVGKPVTIKKVLHYTGVDPATGVFTFLDMNNNGEIDFPDEYQTVVDVSQRYFGGLVNSVSYKNWSLDFLFQFVKQPNTYTFLDAFLGWGEASNLPAAFANRWRKPGDVADIQQVSAGFGGPAGRTVLPYLQSDQAYINASFVRLKNASISWNCPSQYAGKLKIKALKVYAQAQNLITFSSFEGLDPEGEARRLPPLRVITIGLQATL